MAAMRAALDSSGLAPTDIGQINAHGTGTVLNDKAEATAISAVLGPKVPTWSIKGSLGHLMGAAGTTEAIATLLALRHGTVPPTVGLGHIDEQLAKVDLVIGTPRKHAHRYAMSNSFAFGGHNACLVLGE
jgi:3-oxoacyl-[acyl-carrier-protein] synthase II